MYRILVLLLAAATAAVYSITRQPGSLAWSDEFDGPANAAPDTAKVGLRSREPAARLGEPRARKVHEVDRRSPGWARPLADSRSAHRVWRFTSAYLNTLGKYAGDLREDRNTHQDPIWPRHLAGVLGDVDREGGLARLRRDRHHGNIGKEPGIQHGSAHGPGFSDGKSITGAYTLPNGAKLSGDFHTYGIVKSENLIEFIFDGRPYLKVTPASLPEEALALRQTGLPAAECGGGRRLAGVAGRLDDFSAGTGRGIRGRCTNRRGESTCNTRKHGTSFRTATVRERFFTARTCRGTLCASLATGFARSRFGLIPLCRCPGSSGRSCSTRAWNPPVPAKRERYGTA